MKSPRTIVITGASSGIGAALARHYAAPGRRLFLTGRNTERLGAIAEFCRGQGAEAVTAEIDVRDAATLASWLQEADSATPVDLVIANAGISGGRGGHSVVGESPQQLKHIMAVNLDGLFNTVTPLIPAMVQRKRGQIALMGSLAGMRGLPSAPAYSTSKAAVAAYAQALRGWLGWYGVEVSLITPGYIRTPMTAKNPFPMPFLVEPSSAARLIVQGLEKNRARIAFPWQLYMAMAFMSHLPSWLSDPVFARLPAKPTME